MQQIIEVPMKLTVSVWGSWCTGIDDKDLKNDIVNNTHMIMLCEYSGADVSQMSFVYLFILLPFLYSFSIIVPFYGYGYRRSLHLPTLVFLG